MKRLFIFICAVLLLGGTSSETVDSTSPEKLPEKLPVYTHSAREGLILSAGNRWYLEEFDILQRPLSGTLWENSSIVERTSWLYSDESQQAAKKIVTGETVSTETGYDERGNTILVIESDLKNTVLSELVNIYNDKNLLTESVLTKGKKITRTTIAYAEDGTVTAKSVSVDGETVIEYAYKNRDNWTETLYNKGLPVLTVTYINGERVKEPYEKK